MRKLLKIVGWCLGVLVVLVAFGAVVVATKSNAAIAKRYSVAVRPVAIPTDAAALAQGRHLAETRGCNACHGADYAGGVVMEDGAMGVLHGPNLTRGRGGRAGKFTDEDWVRAIRHGVGPDGKGLYIMPAEEYQHLSDADLGALIAYLKTVPAVDRERVPTSLGPVSRVLLATGKMKLAAETIDHANVRPPEVTPGITVEYGRYLATSCVGCHGPNYSGGKIAIGPPSWPPAANLTPDPGGHLAKWSEADFLATIRTGKRPDGTALSEVMPRVFGEMNDVELKALWAFFRTLPPATTGAR